MKGLLYDVGFWSGWAILPVLLDLLPACIGALLLFRRRRRADACPALERFPELTIIVPVYHSQKTLFACIRSIACGHYPMAQICVLVVDNSQERDSFPVYLQCREAFPQLRMHWLESEPGKARALNMALYHSRGTYIITLDSDGELEPRALTHMVAKFQANPKLNCMTGVVLPQPEAIQARQGRGNRLLCHLEFMEYAQSFLAARCCAAEMDMLYTLSGAFSAFRRSAILSSQMYHTETVGEDTHMTFQLRCCQGEQSELCEGAVFYVEPIGDADQLYAQRQRWQRGSLEVSHLFLSSREKGSRPRAERKALLFDHTFSLPRLVWYLTLLCMIAERASLAAMCLSVGLIYLVYLALSGVRFLVAELMMKGMTETRRYYLKNWRYLLLLPLYGTMTWLMRLVGSLNSGGARSWCAKSAKEERRAVAQLLRGDLARPAKEIKNLRRRLNGKRTAAAPGRDSGRGVWYLLWGLELFLCLLLLVSVSWSKAAFDVELSQVFSTILGSLEGTGQGMIESVVSGLLFPVLGGAAVLLAAAFAAVRLERKKSRALSACRRAAAAVLSVLAPISLLYANQQYDLLGYYADAAGQTTIYENYYVDPASVSILSPDDRKNLIYIYVESLETTYASVEDGGRQSVNYIPQLTQLAGENLNFSDTGTLGGFHNLNGSNYTVAALFATTTGLPYTAAAAGDTRMPGVTSLGDILEGFGYVQESLCGSDGGFSSRDVYFTNHGDYTVFDVYSAREAGYVSENYWCNWGLEDSALFQIAREELEQLASGDQPFNFTLLTVDLHAPEGYLCSLCQDTYTSVTANVAACTDRQVAEFVAWCQEQEFCENTVIVITGDHPRMDANLVGEVSRYDRTVYNCFVNAARDPVLDPQSRTFTALDVFPTVLSALGFEIEGDRLGLGTDLFSDRETLTEQLGYDRLYQELSKSSEFYTQVFVGGV
ncbi:MAG: putative glycosyltransferase, exosortase G system-associated [Oscillospiraceae bacterium]|nr:putative glycosyltransferase, exosortase G system-associated [Oscillospiraceae bacterium]